MRVPAILLTLVALGVLVAWLALREGGGGARALEHGAAVQPAVSAESALGTEAPAPVDDEAARELAPPLEAEPAPTPAPADEQEAHLVAVTGRALDERRRPVAGARALVLAPGEETREGSAAADGRFRVEGVPRPARGWIVGGVLVTTSDDRAGAVHVTLPSPSDGAKPEADAGDVLLRPGRAAEVLVTEGGLPAAGARVQLSAGFEQLLVGTAETDADGRARFPLVPSGALAAEARRGGLLGRASAKSDAPPTEPLRIELGAARALDVLVRETGSGAPIAGAEVHVSERVMPMRTFFRAGDVFVPDNRQLALEIAPTGADGRTRVEGLPEGAELTVIAGCEGYSGGRYGPQASGSVKRGASLVEVQLERLAARSVRIPVVDGELPAPPDGTLLAVREQPGMSHMPTPGYPTRALVEGGHVVVVGAPASHFGALAETPDGAIARLWCEEGAELGQETSFRRARAIVVRVSDPSGAPIAGAQALARNQGNNELSEWIETDAEGVARIEHLYGGLANVALLAPGEVGGGRQVGSVDLDAGDGEVRAVLRAPRELELLVTVDGEKRLPSRYVVMGARRVDEDPERAAVRVALAPPEAGTAALWVRSSETLPEKVELTAAEIERGASRTVALRRAGALLLELRRDPEQRVRLSAQAWDEVQGEWKADPFELQFPNAADGLFRFDQLAPGRYRVRDSASGALSPEVDIDPRLGETRVALDLTGSVAISGRVVGPEGADLADARVLVEGLEAPPALEPWEQRPGFPAQGVAPRRSDASFELRVPAGRAITLTAWHPLLRAAAEGGSVTITGGAEDVELRLEPGPGCALDVPEGAGGGSWGPRGLRVLLFRGAVDGEPVSEHHARLDGARARFGGFEPGTYTLWIDPMEGYAPLVLERVELGAGETDLGAPAFSRGSSVRFLVRVPEGQSPPRIAAFATHLGRPEYRRGLNSSGEEEVVLSGLGAGSFTLSYGPVMDYARRESRELTLDGERDELIELTP